MITIMCVEKEHSAAKNMGVLMASGTFALATSREVRRAHKILGLPVPPEHQTLVRKIAKRLTPGK